MIRVLAEVAFFCCWMLCYWARGWKSADCVLPCLACPVLCCHVLRRGQLKALVDIHGADEGLGGNLTEDEIKVICGALDLTSKTARK